MATPALSLLVLLGAFPAPSWTPPTIEERAIVEHALRYSPLTIDRYRDPFALLEVLRVEQHPDIRWPAEFRGASLAVSYRESVWKPAVVGDGGLAKGWFQLHRALHRACGSPDRSVPVASARCWMWRVRVTYEGKVQRRCRRDARRWARACSKKPLDRETRKACRKLPQTPREADRAAWIASWRWVAKGGRFPGCVIGDPRLHLAQLRCWQKGESHSGVCRGYRGGWGRSAAAAEDDEPWRSNPADL
jgi:hypothetical protein